MHNFSGNNNKIKDRFGGDVQGFGPFMIQKFLMIKTLFIASLLTNFSKNHKTIWFFSDTSIISSKASDWDDMHKTRTELYNQAEKDYIFRFYKFLH